QRHRIVSAVLLPALHPRLVENIRPPKQGCNRIERRDVDRMLEGRGGDEEMRMADGGKESAVTKGPGGGVPPRYRILVIYPLLFLATTLSIFHRSANGTLNPFTTGRTPAGLSAILNSILVSLSLRTAQ